MRPMKVTCWLDSPLAGEAPRLDALLEWCMSLRMRSVMESSGGQKHLTGLPKDRGMPVVPGAIPIPLARRKVQGYQHTIPLCSDPILSPTLSDGVAHFTRRFPTEKAEHLDESERRTIVVGAGEFKSYRLPLRIRTVERIVWFCAGRDRRETGRAPASETRKLLLNNVHAVGKKTSQGYGRVSKWDVELAEEDLSWFAPSPDGMVLMRTLPASADLPRDLIGYKKSFGSPVAPHWMAENYAELVVPC